MASEFSNGDRVSLRGDGSYLVVGPDPCGLHPDRTIVLDAGDLARFHSFRTSDLTLIPDTVIVTVELPRTEAEALAAEWEQAASVDLDGNVPDDAASPLSAAYRRLRNAAREVVGDKKGDR